MKKLLLVLALFAGFAVANAQPLISRQTDLVKNPTEGRVLQFNPSKVGREIGVANDVKTTPKKAPLKAAVLEGDIIWEQPEGRLVEYEKNGISFRVTFGTYYASKGAGYVCSVVYGDNNEVYIKDPFLFKTLGTWIKGTIEDGYMVFQPQPVYTDIGKEYNYETGEYEEHEYHYSIRHLKCDLENQCYYLAEDQSFRYKITDDGFVLDVPDQYDVAGMYCDEDEAFVWYGDYECTYKPMPTETISLPEGVKTESYVFNFSAYNSLIPVGFDGNDVYLGNVPNVDEGIWVKGSINSDNKLVIPSNQYVGIETNEYDGSRRAKYVKASNFVLTEDPYYPGRNYYETEAIDEAILDYNPDTRSFTNIGENTKNVGSGWVINYGNTDFIESPKKKSFFNEINLFPYEEVAATPVDPRIYDLAAYDEKYGYGYIGVRVQNLGIEGEYLNLDNLYYRFWVDGKPFTLSKDDYSEIEEDMTIIPYNFSTETQLVRDDDYLEGYHRLLYYFPEFTTFGAQSIYIFEGKEYRSKIYQYNMEKSGVEVVDEPERDSVIGIVEDAASGLDTYYDIMGNRLSGPCRGINIRRSVAGKVSKILVK